MLPPSFERRPVRKTGACPSLSSVTAIDAFLREIDDGWDFKVLVLCGEWVVRIPRTARAAERLALEAELLPVLAPVLPVDVPRFEHVSHEPPFAAYRLIRGAPLRDEDSEGARAFLDTLHAVEVGSLPKLPRPDWIDAWRENADGFRTLVLPLLDAQDRKRGEALLEETETLTGFEPALTHCDLGPSHLLVRHGHLAGVIDWADAVLGDPAVDYAWLLNVAFPDWYVGEELRRRARIYHRLGPWFEVEHGVLTEQPAWVASGLAGVRSRL